MKTIIIGLGKVGVLTLRRVKKLSEPLGPDLFPVHYLAIDQDKDSLHGDHGTGFAALDMHEVIRLSARDARVVLERRADWGECLDWLPEGLGSRTWDDLEEGSAGGCRSLGRLALFAQDELVLDLLQQSLSRMRTASPLGDEGCRIAFVAALGGGTGSGILADLTYLVQRCSNESRRLAYLLLPSPLEPATSRSVGNAYAGLREIQSLKYQGVAFESSFPRVPRLTAQKGMAEPWERIFLFQMAGSDANSLDTSIEKMARSLVAPLHRTLQIEIARANNRRLHIRAENGEKSSDAAFSACGALWHFPVPTTIEHPPLPAGIEKTNTPIAPPTRKGVESPMASDWLFRLRIDSKLCQGRDKLIIEIREKLTLRSRQAEHGTFRNLRELQEAVNEITSILEDPSVSNDGPPLSINEGVLATLDRFAEVKHDIELGVQEYLSEESKLRQVEVEASKEADLASGGKSVQDNDEKLVRRLADLVNDNKEGARFINKHWLVRWWRSKEGLEIVRQRCADMLEIAENPRFREAIKDLLGRRASLLLESSAFESASESVSGSGERSSDKRAVETEVPRGGPSPAESQENWNSWLAGAAKECRSNTFSRTTANPDSQRYAIALIPKATIMRVEELTQASVEPQLDIHCKIVRHNGRELFFYFEDVFHTAHDIVNLREMKEAYFRGPNPELFHIDRRFLEDPAFTDLCDDDLTTVLCGNSGCQGTLANVPRDALVCPKCYLPILSRCGNLGCRLNDLHLRVDGKTKSCPSCGGFNHGAWWPCSQHGKNPVAVPIDKERCPCCIMQHQEDPIRFPSQSIGVRPDLEAVACPKCRMLALGDSSHLIFYVRTDLLPFYLNGVNGHDSANMAALVEKYKLPDSFRCPNCQTHLIPVHHAHPPEVSGPSASIKDDPAVPMTV